jgi:hypothetical protein
MKEVNGEREDGGTELGIMQGRGERWRKERERDEKTRKSRIRETGRTGTTLGLLQVKGVADLNSLALVGEAGLGLELEVGVRARAGDVRATFSQYREEGKEMNGGGTHGTLHSVATAASVKQFSAQGLSAALALALAWAARAGRENVAKRIVYWYPPNNRERFRWF